MLPELPPDLCWNHTNEYGHIHIRDTKQALIIAGIQRMGPSGWRPWMYEERTKSLSHRIYGTYETLNDAQNVLAAILWLGG